MRLFAIGLVLAALPATAQAQDGASPYEEAVAARTSGNSAAGVRLLELWVAGHPGDADARVQLGYAYLALGKNAEARDQFAAVLEVAPGYADAREGLALADERLSEGGKSSFFIVEGAVFDLPGSPDWQELAAALHLSRGETDAIDLRGAWYRRFGLKDVEAGARYTRQIDENVWVNVGASVVSSADFRPSVAVGGGIDIRAVGGPDATVLGFDTAWEDYAAQNVVKLSPRVVQYLEDGAYSITVRGDALVASGNVDLGASLRGDWYGKGERRLFLGAASGPDTDLGIVTQTSSVFGGGSLPLSPDIALLGSAAREWRDGPGDRTELRLGLKFGW